MEGNEVGGSFYLNDTDAIAADATAEQMEILLEATRVGNVNVTRYGILHGRAREGGGLLSTLSFLGLAGRSIVNDR